MAVPILDPIHYWECATCGFRHITRTHQITTELHPCPELSGVMVSLTEVDERGLKDRLHHRVIERGDYIGNEVGVRHDADGRAIMAVHTEHRDGSHDTAVFAATAQIGTPA